MQETAGEGGWLERIVPNLPMDYGLTNKKVENLSFFTAEK